MRTQTRTKVRFITIRGSTILILIESGIEHKRVEMPQITRHLVCNPSIIATADGYECVIRGVNYDLEKSNHEYIFYYGY